MTKRRETSTTEPANRLGKPGRSARPRIALGYRVLLSISHSRTYVRMNPDNMKKKVTPRYPFMRKLSSGSGNRPEFRQIRTARMEHEHVKCGEEPQARQRMDMILLAWAHEFGFVLRSLTGPASAVFTADGIVTSLTALKLEHLLTNFRCQDVRPIWNARSNTKRPSITGSQ